MLNHTTRRLELTELLSKWRARLRPEDVGLPKTNRRRVPGLNRQEVAELVGVSPKWYSLFEHASNERRFSSAFVQRVSHGLQLNEQERALLFRLALPETRLAVDQVERSAHDGALSNLATIRSMARRMTGVASLGEAAAAAADAICKVLSPSCWAGAVLVPQIHAPRIIGVGPRSNCEFPVETAANACIEVNYPNKFGHTTFSENRLAYRHTVNGAFDFQQRTSDGHSFFVAVTESGVRRSEHNATNGGPLKNISFCADQYWAWNSKMEARSTLNTGLFSNGSFLGDLCAMWLEPRAMAAAEIEVLRTVSAIVELALTQ